MRGDPDILDLVGDIYDCAISPALWPRVLLRIAERVGGLNASLSIHDIARRTARFSAIAARCDECVALYAQRYAAINPVLTSGWYCAVDEAVSAIAFVGEREWVGSRYYKEFAEPRGWHDTIGVHLEKSASRYSILSIVGSLRKGPFVDGDRQILQALAPHVRRSASIAEMLQGQALKRDALAATLDLLAFAVVLTDADGAIAYANRAGEQLLDEGSALRRNSARLAARDPKAAAQLKAAIASAARGEAAALSPFGVAVPINGAAGADYVAWALPLEGGLRGDLAAPYSASVAIFVRELGQEAPFSGEIFVRRFAVTPAECRVLMLLVQGMSAGEAANCLGVGMPTVRTHLARLFEKTGARGQNELLSLAASAMAPGRIPAEDAAKHGANGPAPAGL